MMITEYILPYHWKEPIFWLGTRYLYQLVESAYVVYIITDLILFLAFYHSLSKISWIIPKCENIANPKYLYFSAFLFFPFVLSMANTYRTVLALPFFLLALGYGRREVMKCIISFIVAALIHNGYFLFLPVLLLLFKGQFRYFMPITIAACAILMLYYIDLDFIYAMASRDLSSSIGRNIHIYLLLSLVFIISVTLFSENLIINKNNITLLKIMGILFAIYLSCFFYMGNQPLQRLFFLLVSILYPLGGFYIEQKFNSKSEGRVLYCHLTLIPWIYYS
tara:strand:- start:633 stop:1466 length:834 start_codon:yes stop_codon:yes gene_type:complete